MKATLAAAGGGKSINAQGVELSTDGEVQGKVNKVDEKEDDGSRRKRCTLLFGGELRRLSEHMNVLTVAMSKLCRDLQKYEAQSKEAIAREKEWYRWGLVHGGRAVIECKAAMLRADAVERAVHYDSDPEVIDMEIEYEEHMMEEDVVECARSRRGRFAPPLHAQGRVGENVYEV